MALELAFVCQHVFEWCHIFFTHGFSVSVYRLPILLFSSSTWFILILDFVMHYSMNGFLHKKLAQDGVSTTWCFIEENLEL